MKSKRSPRNPPGNSVPAVLISPQIPSPALPAPASAVEKPALPAAPNMVAPETVVGKTLTESKLQAEPDEKPVATVLLAEPPPLVSLAAALEAVHLEFTTEKKPVIPTSAAGESEAVEEKKVLEKIQTAPPAAPATLRISEAAASVPKKSLPSVPAKVEAPAAPKIIESVASPAPQDAPDISEAQVVKDLPAMDSPQPPREPKAGTQTPVPQPPDTRSRQIKPMFVVMLSPEMAPVAKVGGLGDVVLGLSRELERRGNAVEIILPKYDCLRYQHIQGLTRAYENLQVPWFDGVISTTVWFGYVQERKCFFIDPHSPDKFFNRGVYYGHADDVMRFAFFCRAAMEFLFKTGKQPDILHCHDWQTALAPVLLWEMYQHLGLRHPRVCFTIHNFKHQGWTGERLLRATGLHRPEYFFHYDRMRDNNNPYALNLMKAGIVYSNFVTTVSPRHAWEAKDAGQAFGLEPTLHVHQLKYGGVLNGLDYDMFNPEKDPHIPGHFNARTLEKKRANKLALRKRLWLADNEKPILAFIGRLDPQKGPELVRHAIFYALHHGAQFVLLGESPDQSINEHFWGLKRHLNDNPDCHLEIGYSDELAHLIYAGADMMVVPSRFEPCGLTQLISLRYGTVPIVRAVGGLADTVFDKDHSTLPPPQRNGYVFPDSTDASLESALHRAIGCYYEFPEHFQHLRMNGMNSDYSWNHPGQHYLNIYDYIREK